MSRAHRIYSNTIWLTAGQLVATVAALFVTGRVAALLGASDYGDMELAQSTVNFFSPLIFAGIQIPLIRMVVDDPQAGPRAFGDALLIRLALTPLFVGCVLFVAPLMINQPLDPALIWLSAVYWWLIFFFQSLTIPAEASERMSYMGIGTLLMTATGMILSLVAAYTGLGNRWVLGARCAGMVACFVYFSIVLAVVFHGPRFEPNWERYREIMRRGIPLALSFLLGLLLLEQDKVMFAWFLPAGADPSVAVGFYQSATVLAYKFEMIIIPLATAITPALAITVGEGVASFQGLLGKSLRFALILGLPVAVGTGFISREIMDFIFDEEYLAASPVLTVLVWFVPLQFLNRIMAVALAVQRREKWVAFAVLIAVATNFFANAFLIPRFQVLGAAYATIVSEMILVAIYFIVLRKHFGGLLRETKLIRILGAVTIMGIVCTLMVGLNAALIIAAAAIVYGGSILGLKAVTRAELHTLRGS